MNAGVDARTTAGLETGATFRLFHNHVVPVLALAVKEQGVGLVD